MPIKALPMQGKNRAGMLRRAAIRRGRKAPPGAARRYPRQMWTNLLTVF
ncbi:hypothetical protein L515_1805 [Bordetella bronchiseptica MBORD665]|nr:hypothetical protein L516_1643 [Bordetella bronchiseptica MBORD668]KDC87432.1 hypothetical protein L515_1805 [Bordetella bronchiseptica MBORD665]